MVFVSGANSLPSWFSSAEAGGNVPFPEFWFCQMISYCSGSKFEAASQVRVDFELVTRKVETFKHLVDHDAFSETSHQSPTGLVGKYSCCESHRHKYQQVECLVA